MNRNIPTQAIVIADPDPYHTYSQCPICEEHTQLVTETSGPLTNWTCCMQCSNWFSPEVEFE